jgi:Bacteriophage related domain of unknown function
MANQDVVAASIARLQANWLTTPIVLPNDQNFQPPADGSDFVTIQFPFAIEEFIGMAAIGSRGMRETGTIRIVVSVTRGQGQDAGLGYCKTLAALFRLQTFSGIVCFEVSPPIDNNLSDTGAYWIQSISAKYQYDFLA